MPISSSLFAGATTPQAHPKQLLLAPPTHFNPDSTASQKTIKLSFHQTLSHDVFFGGKFKPKEEHKTPIKNYFDELPEGTEKILNDIVDEKLLNLSREAVRKTLQALVEEGFLIQNYDRSYKKA